MRSKEDAADSLMLAASRMICAAMVAAILVADPATGAVLCRTGGGTLKVRDTCKAKETSVDPSALGLRGPQGPIGPDGPPGTQGPIGLRGPGAIIKDANGAVVGAYGGFASSDTCCYGYRFGIDIVVRQVGNKLVRFVTDDRLRDQFSPEAGRIRFISTDCSGTPMIYQGVSPLSAYGLVVNRRLFYADGPLTRVSSSSWLQSPLDAEACATESGTTVPPEGCCVATNEGPTDLVPAAVDDLTSYALPLHLEVE